MNAVYSRDDNVTTLVPAPTPEEVRAALARVLGSSCFEQAGRASEFLRFVVEQTLAGYGRNLKGYVIATAVFGRGADFDPQVDPLVRVEAGRLRRRLTEYYATEGAEDPVRITMARGNYAPEWRLAPPPVSLAPRTPEQTAVAPAPAVTRATPSAASRAATRWRSMALGLATVLVLAMGLFTWQLWTQRASLAAPVTATTNTTEEHFPITVVPFVNLSGEPELDRWAAAMMEEILLRLDRLDVVVVVDRRNWPKGAAHSTEDWDGHSGYVMTGSIRYFGEQTRITVRLIDSMTGTLVWSSAYNEPREAAHLPALQQRMALEIAAAASPYGPLYKAENARIHRAALATPQLRDCFAAYYEYRRSPGSVSHAQALDCFENITARHPEFTHAWAGLATLQTEGYAFHYGSWPSAELPLLEARTAIATARGLERNNVLTELAAARLEFFTDQSAFRATAERVLAMDPDGADALAVIGTLLAISGDSERGLPLVERAIELTPNPPGIFEVARAVTRLREGKADEALEAALNIGTPDWFIMPLLATAAAGLGGRADLAERTREQLLRLDPNFEHHALEHFRRWPFDDALREQLVTGLTLARVISPGPHADSTTNGY